jgi:hypothetical protein
MTAQRSKRQSGKLFRPLRAAERRQGTSSVDFIWASSLPGASGRAIPPWPTSSLYYAIGVYLRNFLIPTMDQWGHYARTESALLLQATTMNPIESWHAVLKHKQINKTTVKQFSLKGIIRHVEVYAKEYDTRAETRRHQFWTWHNPLWKDFEALKEFPYPVQNLLAKEIRLAKDLCVENDEQLLVSSAPEADSQGNAKPPICGKPC